MPTIDERDVFYLTGPTHLTDPRWSKPRYKRAVMACLVKGVYVLEKDRDAERLESRALGPHWWRPFQYEQIHAIIDEKGGHIVGAVYKWISLERPSCAPEVVVAFRGIVRKGKAFKRDLKADMQLMFQRLHVTSRFNTALTVVKNAVKESGVENVCLAGHSLGAAIGLLVGRVLAEEGKNIDTHLFNPPYSSVPLEWIKSPKLQVPLQVLRMVAAAGLAYLKNEQSRQEALDAFLVLKNWFPNLYVNANDPICSSYIGYFGTREYLIEAGKAAVVELAAPHSARGLLQSSVTRKEARPFHLIPCAHLHFVNTSSQGFKQAHGLEQWWSEKLEVQYHEATFDLGNRMQIVCLEGSTAQQPLA